MRKRIVAFMMAGVMALGLTGCDSVLKIEDKKSSNSVDMDMISKFYDQFYEEHTGDAEHFVDIDIDSDEEKTISIDTAPYLDCSANMEYCDGQWIMTIADFLGYAKSDYGDLFQSMIFIFINAEQLSRSWRSKKMSDATAW